MSKKFRAYYKPDLLTKDGALRFDQVNINDELYFMHNKDIWYQFQMAFLDDEWLVQQFTGRLDINGVEVFEGDIIEFRDMPYICKYSETEQAYICVSRHEDFWQYLSDFNNIKVIGNIMETPNLI